MDFIEIKIFFLSENTIKRCKKVRRFAGLCNRYVKQKFVFINKHHLDINKKNADNLTTI